MAFLYDEQKEAVQKMKNGCILCGGVGSGKSRTSLAYYVIQNGGSFEPFKPMKPNAKNLYIITTAYKRDTLEWEGELLLFGLNKDYDKSLSKVQITIDSWNNIGKYKAIEGAFFIFDEQKVSGKGAWVKSFLRIAEYNEWVLLSATPGDKWDDYIPVFIANGFYKNRTEFNQQHCVFARFSKYPKIERWLNVGRLIRLRNSILIDIEIVRPTIRHDEDVYVEYNRIIYKDMMKNRWDIWKNEPFQTAAELCYALRKVVNSDDSRLVATMELFEKHPRMLKQIAPHSPIDQIFLFFIDKTSLSKNCSYPLEDSYNITKQLGYNLQGLWILDGVVYWLPARQFKPKQYTIVCI